MSVCLYVWLCAAADDDDTAISILERGEHRLPFDFALPEQCLPCSFESRVGTVRYYLRVIIDIPYASPPQGLKYFTVIGPHIDCNDDKYAVSLSIWVYVAESNYPPYVSMAGYYVCCFSSVRLQISRRRRHRSA